MWKRSRVGLKLRVTAENITMIYSQSTVPLVKSKIQGNQTSDPVWIGLSYLGNRWLWVNGDSLEYEAWTQGGDQHMCPRWSHSCGALTKEGLWENRDCQKKLNFICY
ncbi:regenerating islet-derived protein 4-like [Polymixia lowei]